LSDPYDVIVVGAGPGGSALSALLARRGVRVLLVDKNERAGGRMMTVHRDGFRFEMFPINGVPAQGSHFEAVLREIGMEDEVELIVPESPGILIYEDEHGVRRSWDMGSSRLAFFRALGIPCWDLRGLFQSIRFLAGTARLSREKIDELYDTSAMEYVDRFTLPKGLRTHFLASFGEGAFEMSSDKTSAAESIKLFQATVVSGGGRYYGKGIGHVFEVCARAVEKFGGRVLMKTRVERINVEEGRITGITTASGERFEAPLVVSSAGIRQTVLKLVGEDRFDPAYVDWIKSLEGNLACAGYRWVLNRPVLKSPMYIYFPEGCVATYDEFEKMARGELKPTRSYIYLGTTSLYPGLAPGGKQLVYAAMSCLGDPDLDIQPYLDYVARRVREIMPELFDCIEKEEVFGPGNVPALGNDAVLPGQGGESYGLALSVGQTGDKQPKGDSPIEGLYYVGCDAGGSGLGTHQAVDSAINVSKMLLDRLG
jgi:prolycopene isomerase